LRVSRCYIREREQNGFGVLAKKTERRRPLGRSRRRWEDNIVMNLKEMELEGKEWITLAVERD